MMSRTGFNCRRCGHCCRSLVDAYRGCLSDADLARWRRKGRSDLLARVETLDLGRGNLLHLAWVDPTTREEADSCPWLGTDPVNGAALCSINAVKPEHCRKYPENRSHADSTGCPGFTPLQLRD